MSGADRRTLVGAVGPIRVVAVVVVLLVAGGGVALRAAPDPPSVEGRVLLRFADPRIDESSGLVDCGRLLVTANDSGGQPLVYAVDAGTGETVGTTRYAPAAVDVEALAPARTGSGAGGPGGPGGSVWVGDIGDNSRSRRSISLYRVRFGLGEHADRTPRVRLRYPDGPHDAETLLADPRTGRQLVVTKDEHGGTVYAAPRQLDPSRVGLLRQRARVPGVVTDGAFLPGGHRVLLRGYDTATLYTYPGFRRVRSLTLPEQDQGEGLAVGPRGRVLLGSEGQGAEVVEVSLPPLRG